MIDITIRIQQEILHRSNSYTHLGNPAAVSHRQEICFVIQLCLQVKGQHLADPRTIGI